MYRASTCVFDCGFARRPVQQRCSCIPLSCGLRCPGKRVPTLVRANGLSSIVFAARIFEAHAWGRIAQFMRFFTYDERLSQRAILYVLRAMRAA